MQDRRDILTVLIVFVILAVVAIFYWDRQQKRLYTQSQDRIKANLLEDWGPGAQQQIQAALRPQALVQPQMIAQGQGQGRTISYKNIVARVAPSVVSVNVAAGVFNNIAQGAATDRLPQAPATTPAAANQSLPPQTIAGQGAGGAAAGPIGNLICPHCATTVPHQLGIPAHMARCPNCQTPMMRNGTPGICRIPVVGPQITADPNLRTAAAAAVPNAQNRCWQCPNCFTSVPCPPGTTATATCPGCPNCGIQMQQSIGRGTLPAQTVALAPGNQTATGTQQAQQRCWLCPNCFTSVPCAPGAAPMANCPGCPSCGVLMQQSPGPGGVAAQTTTPALGNQAGTATPTQQRCWLCPNCFTSMPCPPGATPAAACPGCPNCGVQMNQSLGPVGVAATAPAGQSLLGQQMLTDVTPQFQGTGRGGSGIIVSRDGYVLTNHHVIRGAKTITVTAYSGQASKTYKAALIDEAPALDLAVLKIAGNGDVFSPAALGNSNTLSVGDEILAIGSPFGLSQTTTFGIVSNSKRTMTVGGRTFSDFIQTDAPVNPGSSGGALVNVNGEVIGINTAIYSPSQSFVGIGLAIPINSAKATFPDFIGPVANTQTLPIAFQRGMGLYPGCPPGGAVQQVAAPCPPPGQACPIANTTPEPLPRGQGLNPWCPPGGPLQQAATTQVAQPWLGIRGCPVDSQTRASLRLPMARGVVVQEIFPDSPCLASGLQAGDVITRVDNRSLKDEAMLGQMLAGKRIGDEMKLSVFRGGKKVNLGLRLGPRPGAVQVQNAGFGLRESLTLPGTPETAVWPGQ